MTDTSSSCCSLVQPRLTLDNLLTPVLDCIAELLAGLDRIALLYLAFAAPPLFAPCLRVAIRTARRTHFSRYSEQRHRANQPLGAKVHLSPGLLGHFHATQHQTEIFHWSLILLLRAADRSLLHLPQTGFTRVQPSVAASRCWSLLPIPLSQIRSFTVFEGASSVIIPPSCRSLSVEGDVPWRELAFPPTISSLSLKYITVRPECIDALSQLLPNLRTLSFLDVAPDEGDEDDCKSVKLLLVNHIPSTVKTLILHSNNVEMTTDAVMPALARAIPQLPSLASLRLIGFDPVQVNLVMATLPREGFSELTLGFNVFNGDHVAALERVANSLPTSVGSFSLDLMLDIDGRDDKDDYRLDPLRDFVTRIPLATRNLSVRLAVWDDLLCRTIPISPTLTSLKIAIGQWNRCLGLDDLVARLPTTLTHLTITSWTLRNTLTARSNLARRLPPRLMKLQLIRCELTDVDLVHFQWPSSLLHLDLCGNSLTRLPPTLPSGLHTLVLSRNSLLNDTGFEAVLLPTLLRVLNLGGTKVGDGTAAGLLHHMPMRSEWRRMHVHVKNTEISPAVLGQLRAKFVVVK
ncbi:hypothetical protein AMAG_00516 [Allomyces macrogynus ATCC 38327]|uniref:Uncharacterized protein n=1 Tax=Allomyces macrogynus (strain ATCC 38327) TaxID=578462 RepID=A0A0L0RVX3_ALLM3|nr:hypothetical protein AMAG_00516 [Allomyces macrogynus ATCC 38327]|eukprot:KNE54547.1 hypothetical protein AMAG_00516 [Allomyces macrogynus ATCC 38327]